MAVVSPVGDVPAVRTRSTYGMDAFGVDLRNDLNCYYLTVERLQRKMQVLRE